MMNDLVTTRRKRFKTWMNAIIDVKRKALAYTLFVLVLLTVAFQVQTTQLNDARVRDACTTRINTRDDLRDVLLQVVDISDVLPDNEAAEFYTLNRTQYINVKYPAITRSDC